MVYDGIIEGRYVYLQSCTVDDAEFTLALRQNPALTKFLPRLDITLDQQKKWIISQRKKSGDYFFVVRTSDGTPIGTVSVYNIEGYSAESGRLALIGDSLQNTEASMLLFSFAFDELQLRRLTGYIMADNKRAGRFNNLFGCRTGDPEENEDGELIRRTVITTESFHEAEERLKSLLYR